MLVLKPLTCDLLSVMNQVSQVINFIKSRIFLPHCEVIDSEQTWFLYHTEVRWLSKENVLKSLVKLKAEVILSMKVKKKGLGISFSKTKFGG